MLSAQRCRGMLGWVMLCISTLPAHAQNWPSDSGPTGDYLGSSLRQFERLAPPPSEMDARRERPVPNLPVTDLPQTSVEVGLPQAAPSRQRSTRQPTIRREHRQVSATSRQRHAAKPGRSVEQRLAEQERRIQDLERQLQQR